MKMQKKDFMPEFFDECAGVAVPLDVGVRALRRSLEMNTEQFGAALGVSSRTVEGWELGRPAALAALLTMFSKYGKRKF